LNEGQTPAAPDTTPLVAPVKTAADAAVASGDQAAFKEARRAEKTSGSPAPAPKADSRSAQPVEQVPSTEGSSQDASEASDPTSPRRGNAKTRLVEVDSEIATLRTKLAERDALLARSRAPTPDATPAPTPAPSADSQLPAEVQSYGAYLDAHPGAPLEEFFDARSDARQALKESQREQQTRARAKTEAEQQRVTEFSSRVNARAESDPAFVESVAPAVLLLRPMSALPPGTRPGPEQVIAEEILSSPVAPQVMVALSKPEELARLMAMRTPAAIINAIAKIEARYEDGEPPPAYKHTNTPAPVTTLGKRPADHLAPLEAAIRDGDMSAYKAARQAERAAKYGRR
jgi:hypothetical protein